MSRAIIVKVTAIAAVASALGLQEAVAQVKLEVLQKNKATCAGMRADDDRARCFQIVASDAIEAVRFAQEANASSPRLTGNAPAATIAEAGEQYSSFISAAKADVTKNFKDPFSVQWRELYISESANTGTKFLCGYLNGKNSYGGYTGFKKFYATATPHSDSEVVDDNEKDSTLRELQAKVWEAKCRNRIASIQ